jgi:hypothetical protein
MTVVVVGALAWLAYVALLPHTTLDANNLTVFGTTARYSENDSIVLLPFAAMLVAAAVAGWRRVAPALSIGVAVVSVPFLLAYWTTPQGDQDGLWGLIFFMLPMLGGAAAVVAAIAGGIAGRGEPDTVKRVASMRVGAIVIDAAVFGLLSWLPGKALADAGFGEIPGLVLGLAAAIAFLAVAVLISGATLGHHVFSLRVVDAAPGARPNPVQAIARSAIIVAEFAVAPFVVGLTFIPEVVSIRAGNASLADAICRTRIIRR